MLKQLLIAATVGLGFAVSAPTMAHSNSNWHNHDHQNIRPVHPRPARNCVPGHRIDRRQAKQRNRIRNGVHNGQLVRWERKQLNKQQRRIRHAEQRMRNSGHCLTRQEAQRLMNRLDRASNKIRNLKHNNVRRGHHGGRRHGGHH